MRRPSAAVYRRRRLVCFLVAAAAVGFGWLGLHQLTGASGDGPLTVAGRPVSSVNPVLVSRTRMIVQPGDTLWSIARRSQAAGDIRPLVDAMASQRHGRALQVGETIEVPHR
jgi:hypothetical protein